MKKKVTCMLLASLMAFSFAACDDTPENKTSDKLRIYDLLATEKYLRDEDAGLTESATMTFAGMKNETQSAQLMFNSDKKVSSFDLDGAELTLEGGSAKIVAENVKIYAEKYTEVYAPYYQSDEYISPAGWYPDALVPMDKYQMRKEDQVKAGENQAIWVDIDVPADATAGNYKGTFVLTVNGEKTDIDVSMHVYDIVLPDEVNNPTAFSVWYQNIAYGEGSNLDDGTYERYYEYLWTKRLNSAHIPPHVGKAVDQAYLEYIKELADNVKCTAYIIPSTSIIAGEEGKKLVAPINPGDRTEDEINAEKTRIKNDLKAQLKTILDYNLTLRGEEETEHIDLFKKAMYYYEDEPVKGSYRMQSVRVFCEMLNKAKQELLSEYAMQFTANADLKASFENVHEICPSNYMQDKSTSESMYDYGGGLIMSKNPDGTPNKEKSDGLSFWCPEMYNFNKSDFRATVLERLGYGEKVWWYLCVSNTPRPSYYVESLPVNIRMQNWMQYDYSVQGILYWDVSHYSAERDNYDDLIYSTYGSGEGILLYPGARYGMKDPISSWRLENIRLGQQDYEIFYMLNEELTAAGSTVTAQQLVSKLGKGMYTGTTIKESATSAKFEEARIQLLDIVELFKQDKTEQATALVNQIMA